MGPRPAHSLMVAPSPGEGFQRIMFFAKWGETRAEGLPSLTALPRAAAVAVEAQAHGRGLRTEGP